MDGFLRWLGLGVVFLVWLTVPGALLIPALAGMELPDLVVGAAAVGTSAVFWRGVRTWPAGRKLTDAALAFVVKE